jgi:hypothetical protein
MSVASRIKVSQALLPTGAITVNEIREIFGYEGVEGGDKRLVSLNFAKYEDLSKYQINASKGGDTNEEEPENGTPNDDGASDTE